MNKFLYTLIGSFFLAGILADFHFADRVLTISNQGQPRVFIQYGSSPVVLDSQLVFEGVGGNFNGTIEVSVEGGEANDQLNVPSPSGLTVTGANSPSITLSTGGNNISQSNVQTALRSVTYTPKVDNSQNVTIKKIRYVVKETGSFCGNCAQTTPHYYEFVSGSISWTSARTSALARRYYGLSGYLVTVTSSAENTFLLTKLPSGVSGWLGGTDQTIENSWIWADGPEAGQSFCGSTSLQGASANGCSGKDFSYANWNGGEPNDSGGNEDYLQMYSDSGTWNDLPNTHAIIGGYFIEYGGLGEDPTFVLVRIEKHNAFIPGSQF